MSRMIQKKECIETDRLTLQPFKQEDRKRLVEMLQNHEITATYMVPEYTDESQYYALSDKFIALSCIEDTTRLVYGIYLNGYLIGFINDCGHDDNTIEVGYVIDPAYKGRGFATEAVTAAIKEIRGMGFKRVIAGYFEGNIGSRKVMEKSGMHLNSRSYEEEYRGKTLTCYECEIEL